MAPAEKKDDKAKGAKGKEEAKKEPEKPKEDKPKEGEGKAKPKQINQSEAGGLFENCYPKNPGAGCYLLYVLPFFIGLAPYLLTRKPAKPKCSRSPPRPPCC